MHQSLDALTKGWSTPRARALDRSFGRLSGERPAARTKTGSFFARLRAWTLRLSRLRRERRELHRLDARTLKDIGMTCELRRREVASASPWGARP